MAMARCSTAALFVIVFSATALSSTVSGQVTGGRLVGGEAAWNSPAFDYQAWADGITFYIGDELIFQYDIGIHNVVVADSPEAFEQCRITPNYGVYDGGFDRLVMNDPGTYYFMCEYSCLDNMKFKVTPIY